MATQVLKGEGLEGNQQLYYLVADSESVDVEVGPDFGVEDATGVAVDLHLFKAE
jgi:hypothetical protein